jgi:hypothetical protein
MLDGKLASSPFLTPGFTTAHIVEQGDAGQGRLRHLIERRGMPLAILPKWNKDTGEKIHAFAACDLFAYYARRAIERQLAGKPKQTPPVVAKHFRGIPTYELHADSQKLRCICEMYPEDFPRREARP